MNSPDLYKTTRSRRASAYAFTLVRVVVGATLLLHGWQKLSDVSGTIAAFGRLGFPAPEASVYLAIFSEILGGIGLLAGMLTRLAALGPLLTTAAAISFAPREQSLVVEHGGVEYSLLLCAVCLHFAIRGAGRYSVDAIVAPRRPKFRRRHRHVAVTT